MAPNAGQEEPAVQELFAALLSALAPLHADGCGVLRSGGDSTRRATPGPGAGGRRRRRRRLGGRGRGRPRPRQQCGCGSSDDDVLRIPPLGGTHHSLLLRGGGGGGCCGHHLPPAASGSARRAELGGGRGGGWGERLLPLGNPALSAAPFSFLLRRRVRPRLLPQPAGLLCAWGPGGRQAGGGFASGSRADSDSLGLSVALARTRRRGRGSGRAPGIGVGLHCRVLARVWPKELSELHPFLPPRVCVCMLNTGLPVGSG
ncbi:uncharacterized protein ACOB8E_023634 [Sarcophilus harrisii]